jgi:hypothetical protein
LEEQVKQLEGSRFQAAFLLVFVSYFLVRVARMEEKRNAYRLLVGKPEGKRPLGRPRRKWVDIIRMDLGEM